MGRLIHEECPMCGAEGVEYPAQDETVLVCPTESCRVFTYAAYFG